MATVNEKMIAICDAIREKTSGTELLGLDAIAQEIPNVYNAGYEKGKAEGGIDWSKTTDFRNFSFSNNRNNLVAMLKFEDTSSGTNFASMFNSCSKLTEIPKIDTSKGTNFSSMFGTCVALTEIPEIDTSKGTNFTFMFDSCRALVKIPKLDVSGGTNFERMFYDCRALEEVRFDGSINASMLFSQSQNLSHDSLMSIINALTDYSEDTSGTTYKLTLGATNLAKLSTEELQTIEDKGWTYA